MKTTLCTAAGLCFIGLVASLLFTKISANKFKKKHFRITFDALVFTTIAILFGAIIGWIFYMSIYISVVLGTMSVALVIPYKNWKSRRREIALTEEFLEINRLLVSELYAGRSVERAYVEILSRLKKEGDYHYPYMQEILERWCLQFEAGWRFVDVIRAFGNKSTENAIRQFSTMFETAYENGANLLEVIEMTNRIIRDKRQIQREIDVLISEKKLEQKLLSFSPVALLLLMQNTSYAFVAPLYETAIGRGLMTVALVIFIACYFWSNKMTEVSL